MAIAFNTRKAITHPSKGRVLEGNGVDPDVVVAPTIAALLAGHDWHIRYPSATLLANQTITAAPCHHLKLTRTDGSTAERFYEVKSGLLVREISTEFDEAGIEQPTTTDIVRYEAFFGIRRPVELRIKSGAQTLSVVINTVTYSPSPEATNFEIPHDVIRAIVASRNKSSTLPNPVDLIDKFVAATGGKNIYEGIKTEVVTAEVTFTDQNSSFPC